MPILSQNITLDIGTKKAGPIHFVQGEAGRNVVFTAINSNIIDPDTGEPIAISGGDFDGWDIHILKPDGNFTIEHMTYDGDADNYYYILTDQDCIKGGAGVYDVSMLVGTDVIYTAHGCFVGDFRAIDDSTINSVSIAYGIPFPDGFQEKLTAGANITIDADNVISATGGGGGTSNYNDLTNKPKINNVELSGNKTLNDLGITDTTYTAGTGLDLTGTTFALNNTTQTTLSAVAGKQDQLTFDAVPTNGSGNPVTSDGIYDALADKIDINAIGVASGVAELNSSGVVPSSQLPSYVDDVIDGYLYNGGFYEDSAHTQLITPESGKIYIDVLDDLQYRWTGSSYGALGGSLILGETSSTAYRGDRGKIAYDTALENKANICDDYDSSLIYQIGDYCTHAGIFLKCNHADTTGAFNSAYWDYATLGDELQHTNGNVTTNSTAIATLNSNITGVTSAITGYNTSYIDGVSITCIEICNNLVILSGAFKPKATNIPNGTQIITGIPKVGVAVFGSAVNANGNAYKIVANANNTYIQKDEAQTPTNSWYNFMLVYIKAAS